MVDGGSTSAAAAAAAGSANIARQTFELANDVLELDPRVDAAFHYDEAEQARIRNEAPWKNDPNFFQRVRISSAALIKMMIHTRAGGIYEVMGTMTGKVDVASRTIYIMDAFALPVQGTETRVNAGDEAYEFMVQWQEDSHKVGRLENAIGWYHSHPGYGCWLSGIDVNTQMTNQQYQDPFVAVVIDPNRTISAGRVDIGAFRTYPADYKPPNTGASSEYQTIPLSKIEDFGVHADRYYPLKVEHFKSSLDAKLLDMLWNKYWVSTLAQSPVVVNRSYAVGQLEDLAEKLRRSEAGVARRGGASVGSLLAAANAGFSGGGSATAESSDTGNAALTTATGANSKAGGGVNGAEAKAGGSGNNQESKEKRVQRLLAELKKREQETPLAKAANDSNKISLEAHNGLISQVLKDALFNRGATGAPLPPPI